MLMEYLVHTASVQSVFFIGFFAALIVAMVLGYWSRMMLLASLKRENGTLRDALSWKDRKIEHLEAREKRFEKVLPADALLKINQGYHDGY